MGLFNRRNKAKRQDTGIQKAHSTRCDTCLRSNITCPYGNEPTTITNNGRGFIRSETCDAFVDLTNAKYQGHNRVECPHCGSHEIGSQAGRFVCNTCGSVFS